MASQSPNHPSPPSLPIYTPPNNSPPPSTSHTNFPPFLLQRSISIRQATTTDGFKVLANKHYTYLIEEGTLLDALQKGYIDSREAMQARTMKAQRIAREIMETHRRKILDTNEPIPIASTDASKAPSSTIEASDAEKDDAEQEDDGSDEEYDSSDEDISDDEDEDKVEDDIAQ